MNIEELRNYCITKKAVTESFPFDETTLVFKVAGKMFALIDLEGELSVNLKCEPERAIKLREEYPAITSGYHMDKKHWNTIKIDDSLSDALIFELIDHSYDLIISKLTKKQKLEFGFNI